MLPPRLELSGISKLYPGVRANDGVDLVVQPGEIHAVLGENGAGKSTLMKVIFGAIQPDAGTIRYDGQKVCWASPHEARAAGIAMVFQHFSLFETLTVAENVWLGLGADTSLAAVVQGIQDKAGEYGLALDPHCPVHALSVGEMQRVEILRALLTQPKLLILDEPTSVLTPQAVQRLFGVLRRLAAQGCSILYISHKLHEIQDLCSRCTVLQSGRVSGVCDPRLESQASLSRLMIGAEPPALRHVQHTPGAVVLQVHDLSLEPEDPFGVTLDSVALHVRAGEVVGVAGVSGNGQAELLRALSGEDLRAPLGSVCLDGVDVSRCTPAQRRRRGLHGVPEDRLGRGAVGALSLAHNLLLTRTEAVRGPAWLGGWLDLVALRGQAQAIIDRFGVRSVGAQASAQSLSGGNLQKFIMGREIDAQPRLLIASQPTWGVDVGASAQIRAELLALRDVGCAVLIISEELDELFEVSDRLYVMARGRVSPSLTPPQATLDRLGAWMSGLWDAQPLGGQEDVCVAA